MSRIGKKPIPVPSGVDVTINGSHVAVKGPKGSLELDAPEDITIAREGDDILVGRPDDELVHEAANPPSASTRTSAGIRREQARGAGMEANPMVDN